MKKAVSLFLAALLLVALALPAMVQAEEKKVLNIFTWATYIDQDTILTPFTEETGIEINYSFFNSNEEMLTKLQANKGSEYDIVLASDYVLDALRVEGLIQPLSKELIPNFQNIKKECLGKYYDPDSLFVVPYVVGTPSIVYDPALVDFEITGVEDLWNPALKDNVSVLDDARNIVGITLKTLGQSFNTTDPDILAQAAEKLNALRPNIRVFDYDTAYQQVISGECAVGYMFTPQAVIALQERPDLKVVFPKEGLGIGIDGLVIPLQAPHRENANKFLDFLLRPEIGAKIAEVQQYNNPNAAAEPLLPEIFQTSPALNPPAEMLDDAEFIQYLGADESKFWDIWTAFKQL